MTPGTRLGPYEIIFALGAGGMGEVATGGKLLVVPLLHMPLGGTFSFGTPEPLFALTPYFTTVGRTFDVSPDGKRLLAIKVSEAGKQQDTIIVVSDWFEELRARVPTAK